MFNTPQAAEVTDRLAKATEAAPSTKSPGLGRWVEPNGAFAAATSACCMPTRRLLLRQGTGQVGDAGDAGRGAFPGRLADPELAWPGHLQGLAGIQSWPGTS